jgi:hypothetical protein
MLLHRGEGKNRQPLVSTPISEGAPKGTFQNFWTKKTFQETTFQQVAVFNLGLRQGASKIFSQPNFYREALSQASQLEHGRPYDSAMPDTTRWPNC